MKAVAGPLLLFFMLALVTGLLLFIRRSARRQAGWDVLAEAFPAQAGEGVLARTAGYCWTGHIFLRWSLKVAALPRGLYAGPTLLGRTLYGIHAPICIPWEQVSLDAELGAQANFGYRLAFRLGPTGHPFIIFGGAAEHLSEVLKG